MKISEGLFFVLALSCVAMFIGGCGGGGASQDELDQARAEGAKQAREDLKIQQLEQKVNKLGKQNKNEATNNLPSGSSSGGASSTAGGPVASCGGGVSVGANTSCGFAMNVAGEFGSNPGSTSISTTSPVTGQTYTMSCSAWGGGGTVCRGGNNASVFLP